MILQNGFRDWTGTFRCAGAGVQNNAYPAALAANFWRTGALRNLIAGQGIPAGYAEYVALPQGHNHPSAFMMPQKAGGMGAAPQTAISLTAADLNLAAGINIDGSGTITITVPDADLQLVVSAVGSSSITLTSAGNVAGSIAAAGAATFTITVPAVTLGAIIDAVGAATMTLTGALEPYAVGHLAGDILPYTELSPQALATEILDLQDVETGLTVRQALRLIAAATAGKVSGASGTTITIRNAVADDADRIVATVDSNGNRTAFTYDLE